MNVAAFTMMKTLTKIKIPIHYQWIKRKHRQIVNNRKIRNREWKPTIGLCRKFIFLAKQICRQRKWYRDQWINANVKVLSSSLQTVYWITVLFYKYYFDYKCGFQIKFEPHSTQDWLLNYPEFKIILISTWIDLDLIIKFRRIWNIL